MGALTVDQLIEQLGMQSRPKLVQALRWPQGAWRFADADEFHSAANVAKMSAGVPLDDADRGPWLRAIGECLARGGGGSCPGPARAYRRRVGRRAPAARSVAPAGDRGARRAGCPGATRRPGAGGTPRGLDSAGGGALRHHAA